MNIASMPEQTLPVESIFLHCVKTLTSSRYLFLQGSALGEMCDDALHAWADFAACWDGLTLDRFMGDNGRYRYRRYAALRHRDGEPVFRVMPHAPYQQAAYINKLNGGIERIFDPLEDRFVRNPSFVALISKLTALFSEVDDRPGNAEWDIRIHPYRIVAKLGTPGLPTPEGLHRDGVDYIVSMMVGRHGIVGGETDVTDSAGRHVTRVCLKEPMDIMIADDAATMHSVTPITPEGTEPGWRDVLVIAYTLVSRDEAGPL